MKAMLSILIAAAGLVLAACATQSAKSNAETPKEYSFWPQAPDEPRVQFVASFSSSEDVSPTKSTGLERVVFGKEAENGQQISKPYGIAIKSGKIYVTDMRSKALLVLDVAKKETRLVGTTGINRLDHPVAVAVADDGMIYVADNSRGSIFVFDSKERFVTAFGFPKFVPVALAVSGDRLYVADRAAQNVVMFSRKDGKKIGVIGSVGDEDGQFRLPLGVATDKAGNVYIVDMMRCRLQKFTRDGEFISGMGSLGDYRGSFARPKHLAVDSEGIIYVVDAAFENVQMFNSEYRVLMHFGALGEFPGAMNLPAGVAVSDEGLELFKDRLHPGFEAKRLIVVSNQFGPQKVSVYALGQRREGFAMEQLASAQAKLPTGMGTRTAEELKMQNPGGEEPPTDAPR